MMQQFRDPVQEPKLLPASCSACCDVPCLSPWANMATVLQSTGPFSEEGKRKLQGMTCGCQ